MLVKTKPVLMQQFRGLHLLVMQRNDMTVVFDQV